MDLVTDKILDLKPDEISPETLLANALQDPIEWAKVSGAGRPESYADTTGKHISLQNDAPTTAKEGDVWFDQNDNNKPYKLVNNVWTSIRDGLITSASLQGWVNSLVFSATDYRIVAWTTGTIALSNGNTYTISAGNTGNMAAVTYIFLDTGVSSTVLQTTTTVASAVGVNRILVAVAKPNAAVAKYAEFQVFGGYGQSIFITADVIAANTITGNEIAANTITANKLNVATLSAITADLGTITAGAISGVTIAIGSGNAIFKADSNGIYLGNAVFGSAPFRVTMAGAITATSATITGALTTSAGSSLDGQYLAAASVASAAANLALRGWTITCAFSVTDNDTVAWGAGNFTASDGTTYSINAGNTGNMVAKTYIYLDIAVSTTALQTTTTATTAIGNGKVLIGVAQNNATEAIFQLYGGIGGMNIDAASIVAGSITANEIAAATITANKLNVATLSAISADLGTITAGSINVGSGNILLDGAAKAFSINNATFGQAGIQLQYNAGTPRAYIGNGVDQYFKYDGTKVIIAGNILNIDSSTDIIIGQMQTTYNFTCGEVITAGNAVCLGGQTIIKLDLGATLPGDQDIGRTTIQQEAQSFSGSDISGKVNTLEVGLLKTGTPTDNVVITVETNNAGAPSGTVLATATIAGSALTTSLAYYSVTLDSVLTFSAGTTYWVRFKRSGSLSDTNYFRVQDNGSSCYANGTMKRYNGSTWTDLVSDTYLKFKHAMTEGQIYQSSALHAETTSTFIGFAQESKSAGQTCKVQISDVWTTSGLTIASIYYLSNTYGAIATSAGTVSKKIGLAISTTKLNLLNMI